MVHHVEWANQPMVLAQPGVKVFVTHGGASSIAEAASAHVPMLLIPSGGDRQANAARLVDQKYCVSLNLHTFTAKDVMVGVELLSGNEKVIERLKWQQRVNDHAGGGCPEAARQLQYILKDGYKHLIPVDTDLGILAAGSLDLMLLGLIALHVIAYLVYSLVVTCFLFVGWLHCPSLLLLLVVVVVVKWEEEGHTRLNRVIIAGRDVTMFGVRDDLATASKDGCEDAAPEGRWLQRWPMTEAVEEQ